MDISNLLLLAPLLLLYNLFVLNYTLCNNYAPTLSKIASATTLYRLISRSYSRGQNLILLCLTQLSILLTVAACYIIVPVEVSIFSIITLTLILINVFAFFHAKLQRRLNFKINLVICTPLLLMFYLICFPLLLICKHVFSFFNLGNTPNSTLKDFFLGPLSELKYHVPENDKSLVESICLFDSLEARQIMIPKVDMFCLDQNTSVYEAAKSCIAVGYSRIPVYAQKIDNIQAVLLFKDLLKATLNLTIDEQKNTSIHEYISPIIFSPETKKIKDLFQEIKKQRIHATIIINEYGCTEGLVTMEDILEELLGSEILDETDVDEEILFIPIKDSSWIVNPKMSIIDARKHLNLDFKDSQEYETITGYIFSKMGTIPKPGAHIQEDSFNISILKSDQKKIDKVKITKNRS